MLVSFSYFSAETANSYIKFSFNYNASVANALGDKNILFIIYAYELKAKWCTGSRLLDINKNECQDRCGLGTFQYKYWCFKCPYRCEICAEAEKCQVCQAEYFLKRDLCVYECPRRQYSVGETCFDCQVGCSKCGDFNQCLECLPGFYQTSHSCFPCHGDCSNCRDGTFKDCITCALPK